MATNTRHIAAPPAQVFAVLADGWAYSNWVVGTSHMRAVEAAWPAVGARLFHAAGTWPVVIRDESVVEDVEQDRRLVVLASGRPAGKARVVLDLVPDGDGTTVTIHETPVAGPGEWVHNPVFDAVLKRRNTESLARLAAIAERRTTPGD